MDDLIGTDRFFELYVELLTQLASRDEILDALFRRWELERIYNVLKRELIDSRKKKSRNALSRTLRRVIIKEIDQNKCQYCGSKVDYFEVDHIKPIDDLGLDTLDNVCAACHYCNRLKGDRKKEESKREVERRRKDFIYARCIQLFETKKGRSILKRFLLEEIKD